MIPYATAVTMSAQGAGQVTSNEELAIGSQFDAQIILAAGKGLSTTPAFTVQYTGTSLNAVIAAYQGDGYTVTVGQTFYNPRWNSVTISW